MTVLTTGLSDSAVHCPAARYVVVGAPILKVSHIILACCLLRKSASAVITPVSNRNERSHTN